MARLASWGGEMNFESLGGLEVELLKWRLDVQAKLGVCNNV
jgi:hypothetical protein